MRSYPADLAVAQNDGPVVLVTLTCPGFTVRAASRPVEIRDPAGDGPYLYDALVTTFQPIDREIDLFALEAGDINSARIGLVLPGSLSGIGAEMDGHHLAASRCEVALIWPGQVWAQRDVIIGRGNVSGLSLGIGDEETGFVTEALPPATGALIGGRLISDDSLPDQFFTRLDGRYWPVIIGRVYGVPAYKLGAEAAGTSTLGICGHAIADTSSVPSYYEGDEQPKTAFTPAGTVTFVSGTSYSYLLSDSTADFATGTDSWTVDLPLGGIASVQDPRAAALGVDGVVARILADSGEVIDFDRMRRCYELLRGREIGVYVDKPTPALTILRDRVMPFLPLIEEVGQGGLWLRYTDIASQPAEIELVEGVHLIGRRGAMRQVSDPDDLCNSFTIEYAYDHAVGAYASSVTVDKTNHPLCRISEQLYGKRPAATLQCPITWDKATAAWMVWTRANRLALPRFATTWVADPSLYWLREGVVVSLTSDTLGVSKRKAVIRRARMTQDPPLLTIEAVPGPL